jgi:glucose/arabinose dehydrogenase
MKGYLLLSSCCLTILIICLVGGQVYQVQGQHARSLKDNGLAVQVVTTGIDRPTSMAFLGADDLLVLEQYNGTVLRIKDGKILPAPLLDVNVGNTSEQGMLGIEVMPQSSGHPYVFLYFTETATRDGGEILGNRLYRYTFTDDANGGKLTNRTLLLDLPGTPNLPGLGAEHHGGKLATGPDGNLYLAIGDVRGKTQAQNLKNGADADGSGGILRVTPDGKPVGNGILGSGNPLDKYFAYGIRNSYGIDFDPLTGNLWDTENGPSNYDEINLVQPGFNSGWQSVIGFIENDSAIWPPLSQQELLAMSATHIVAAAQALLSENSSQFEPQLELARQQLDQVLDKSDLYNFNGKGNYSDPEFAWKIPVAPTAIRFFNSSSLGDNYSNRMFVAEFQSGKILVFELSENRTSLDLPANLYGKVANTWNETGSVTFGEGFDGMTDMRVGPDGFLYIVERNAGIITRIVPKSTAEVDLS